MPSPTRSHRLLPLLAPVLALLPSRALAQSSGTGMLDGVPFVLSVQEGELPAPVATGSDSLDKPAGIYSTHPGKADLGPKYNFLGCDEFSFFLDPNTQIVPMAGPAPDIDALSIGYDWISALPDGLMYSDPSPGWWAAIVFSVTKATTGLSTNSGVILRESTSQGGKASGDLFSYLWPGSQVPPMERVNEAVLSIDSTEIDLHGGGSPVPVEMDAVDIYLSLYSLIGAIPGFDLPDPVVYFSVTDATKGRIPSTWVGNDLSLRSGATIFSMTIRDVSTIPGVELWKWEEPQVMWTPASLGVQNTEDIDALAYDQQHQYLLISTDLGLPGSPARDPISFVNLLADAPSPVPLEVSRTPTTVKASERVDLGPRPLPDDINSICAIDPRGNLLRGIPHGEIFHRVIGSPNVPLGLVGDPFIKMVAYQVPGPGLHFLARELPVGSPSGVLLSALPSAFQIGPQASVLLPHLNFIAWDPQLSDQQQRFLYPPLPGLQGLQVYYQTVGLEITSTGAARIFATYILDLTF